MVSETTIMNYKILTIAKIIIVTTGISLIAWKANWIVALGVFFLLWANNVDYKKR